MKTTPKRINLAILQSIIGVALIILVSANVKHAIIYGVLGIVALVACHWFLREKTKPKTKPNVKMLLFVLGVFAVFIPASHFSTKLLYTNHTIGVVLQIISLALMLVLLGGAVYFLKKSKN